MLTVEKKINGGFSKRAYIPRKIKIFHMPTRKFRVMHTLFIFSIYTALFVLAGVLFFSRAVSRFDVPFAGRERVREGGGGETPFFCVCRTVLMKFDSAASFEI